MNRIDKTFEQLSTQNKKALIPYITAGDPRLSTTLKLMETLVGAGADILEIGIAFSDPVADGSIIQAGHQRALHSGTTLVATLEMVQKFRKNNQTTPVVLMSYVNPIENMGYDNFVRKATQAGIDGIILVDMPPEEGEALMTVLKAQGIHPIFLMAPTTTEARLKNIAENARGFLYAVSVKGVTGTKEVDVSGIQTQLESIRKFTQIPVGVGFGIKNAKSANAVAAFADAVIVGSAYVNLIEKNIEDENSLIDAVTNLTQSLRQAIDSPSTNTTNPA